MNTIRIAAIVFIGALFSVQDVAPAQAQEVTSATIKVVNRSDWMIDCHVYWGNTVKNFTKVPAFSTSTPQSIVVSNTERYAVCKRTGGSTATSSGTLRFNVSRVADYNLTCYLARGGSSLACSISEDLTAAAN